MQRARIAGLVPIAFLCLMPILLAGASSLLMGDFEFSAREVINGLINSQQSQSGFVIWELRLPRYLVGVLAGASLGMAGAIVQSITRNPLASPSLMGVSSGAAFAVVLCSIFFNFSNVGLLSFGTVGGMVAAVLTFSIAWKNHLNPIYLTLAGMSISLFFAAGITVLLVASNSDSAGIYYWLAGSLVNRTWQHVFQLMPYVAAGLILGAVLHKPLNILMLDDTTSRSLGLPVKWWRLILGLIAVLLTAATVAVAGPISFVGLVAPHMVRFYLNSRPHLKGYSQEHKVLLPCSAMVGAGLISCADLLAKYQEVPVGILCILFGGPLFVYLIRKQAF